MEWEEDNVRGGLTESEHVGIVVVYDTCVGAKCQEHFCEEGLDIICELSGTIIETVNLIAVKFFCCMTAYLSLCNYFLTSTCFF